MKNCRPRKGFTLVELMVAIFVSLILMSIGGAVYSYCLRLYRESQAEMALFENAKLINRDLRDFFKRVVPVPGNWVIPKLRGVTGGVNGNGANFDPTMDQYYQYGYDWPPKYAAMMNNTNYYDAWFSGPQYYQTYASAWYNIGYRRNGPDYSDLYAGTPEDWAADTWGGYYPGNKGWWMPGFFGGRDASKTSGTGDPMVSADDVTAGAWGWPKADYRLDADADDLKTHGNLACWFYAEHRAFNNPLTMTLDNANLLLCSMKFSVKNSGTLQEQTGLSLLKHMIVGFDITTQSNVKEDASNGNLLRAIRITPYCLDVAGTLKKMGDNELGTDPDFQPVVSPKAGLDVPRAFDVQIWLRHPTTYKRYQFGQRIFCGINPQ